MRPHSPSVKTFWQLARCERVHISTGQCWRYRVEKTVTAPYIQPLPVPSTSARNSRRPWSAQQCAVAHYRLSPNWRLFGRLRSTRTFSVNSVPRVASGTAGLCTSPIAMPFPVKMKAPSLKGLFSSSKKRTKTQGQGAPEVQSEVPDR
jgi:hypothetical protein